MAPRSQPRRAGVESEMTGLDLAQHRDADYGDFCPLSRAAEIYATRWTPLIIRNLLLRLHARSRRSATACRASRAPCSPSACGCSSTTASSSATARSRTA